VVVEFFGGRRGVGGGGGGGFEPPQASSSPLGTPLHHIFIGLRKVKDATFALFQAYAAV